MGRLHLHDIVIPIRVQTGMMVGSILRRALWKDAVEILLNAQKSQRCSCEVHLC